jgi:integrase
MPSVHKDYRGKTPFWIGAYIDEFGRRRKQSTKTEDKREAKTIVEGWQRAADLARAGRLTENKAREVVNDILERIGKNRIYAPTVQRYLEGWLRKEKGTLSENAYGKKELVVRLFLEALDGRETLPIEDVTEADIVTFRDKLLADGRRARTVNTMVRDILSKALRDAQKTGLIRLDPAAALKAIRGGPQVEKGTFSADQIRRLINTAEGDWKGLILAGFFTGARLSDLANMQWRNVDLAERTITFRQRKTNAVVKIPIHPDLQDHLLNLPSQDLGENPVFPALFGRRTSGTSGLSMTFTRIMKKAGIVSGYLRTRAEGVSRTVNALTYHSLRHSFNSTLVNAGVPQELRMKLTGHSSADMNAIYSHHEFATIRAALDHLPRISQTGE